MLGSLRIDDYRWLWLGSMATQVGLRMQDVALGWLVLELTDSSFYLGLTSFAQSFPLLLSPLGGILADKWDRRKLLITTQITATALIWSLATLVGSVRLEIWPVLILVSLSGGVFALYFMTRQAAIPAVVNAHRLLNAFSLDFAGSHVMRVVGPSVAGILVAAIGPGGCFYLQGVGYLTAGFLFLRMKPHSRCFDSRNKSIFHDLGDQWRYVVENGTIFNLIGLALVIVPFGMTYVVLMPVFARDVLGVGPSGLGMLLGATGIGAILVTLSLAATQELRWRGPKLLLATILFGMALILFSLSRRFVTALILLMIVGGSGAVFQTMNSVLLQDMTPDDLRGRVASAYLLVWGLAPVGSLLMGAMADVLGAPLVLALGGAICVCFTAVWATVRPSFRKLD